MSLFKWLDGKKVVGIVDNQFGDTGKGKFVNLFTDWADVTVRGTGGANAGHTVCIGDKKHTFHLVPSGITHDHPGKQHIIGSGVALDPKCLIDELEILQREGLSWNNLCISHRAHLVMPYHILEDRFREKNAGKGKIGTTGRGIGPTYQDHVARLGLTVNDLLNVDQLAAKTKRAMAAKHFLLCNFEFDDGANFECVVDTYRHYGAWLADMICETDVIVRLAVQSNKRVLLEGAQGLLLSVNHGTYPYVTSSDCSIHGLAAGCGLTMRDVNDVLGITKAFHMSRVGEGPFPTEMGSEKSRQWCATATQASEAGAHLDATLQSDDPFSLGIAIRKKAGEYGTTTGRARRIGWLDLPLLRHAISVNGPNIALTMLDVLDDCPVIRVCTSYKFQGKPFRWGPRMVNAGDGFRIAIPELSVLDQCTPEYEEFPGWLCSTRQARSLAGLPDNLWNIVRFVEDQTGAKVHFVSVGPDRDQTIAV